MWWCFGPFLFARLGEIWTFHMGADQRSVLVFLKPWLVAGEGLENHSSIPYKHFGAPNDGPAPIGSLASATGCSQCGFVSPECFCHHCPRLLVDSLILLLLERHLYKPEGMVQPSHLAARAAQPAWPWSYFSALGEVIFLGSERSARSS